MRFPLKTIIKPNKVYMAQGPSVGIGGIHCSYNNKRNALLPLFLSASKYIQIAKASSAIQRKCAITYYYPVTHSTSVWKDFLDHTPFTLTEFFIPGTEEVYIVGLGVIFSQNLEPLVYVGLPHRFAVDYVKGLSFIDGKFKVIISEDALTSKYPHLKHTLETVVIPAIKTTKCSIRVKKKVPLDISVFKVTKLKTFPFTTYQEMQTKIKKIILSPTFQNKYCKWL